MLNIPYQSIHTHVPQFFKTFATETNEKKNEAQKVYKKKKNYKSKKKITIFQKYMFDFVEIYVYLS